jgi:molybdenum cofactor biosynthesis enzyme
MCKDTISTFELMQMFPNNEAARLYILKRSVGMKRSSVRCVEVMKGLLLEAAKELAIMFAKAAQKSLPLEHALSLSVHRYH